MQDNSMTNVDDECEVRITTGFFIPFKNKQFKKFFVCLLFYSSFINARIQLSLLLSFNDFFSKKRGIGANT